MRYISLKSLAPKMHSKDRARKNKKKEFYYKNNKEEILSDRKEKYDADKRWECHEKECHCK